MNNCFIFTGTGFGDHFLINGAVRVYSSFFDKVYISCESNKYEFLQNFYKDNDNIIPVPLQQANNSKTQEIENIKKKLNISFFLNLHLVDQGMHNNPSYQHKMYELANLPFDVKYEYFHTPYNKKAEILYEKIIKHKEYCLVNCVCSTGKFEYKVFTDLPVYYLDFGYTDDILDFEQIIKNASEIHCMDTSFYHWIDCIDVKAKLFFHHIRHPKNINWDIYVSPKWTQIEDRHNF
jgi:hypothetical protein